MSDSDPNNSRMVRDEKETTRVRFFNIRNGYILPCSWDPAEWWIAPSSPDRIHVNPSHIISKRGYSRESADMRCDEATDFDST